MEQVIEIQWVSGTIDEARKVCRYLVQEGFIASARIIPWVESITMLDDQLETSQQSLVCMQTVEDKFQAVKEVIEKNSRFQIPEISYFLQKGENEAYRKWLTDGIRDKA